MKYTQYFLTIILITYSNISCDDNLTDNTGFIDPTEKYSLIWSDEFDGITLDESKWEYRFLGPRRKAINVKEAVSLDGNGNLIIRTFKDGDNYYTGMIGTENKFQSRFGYWECRMELQKQLGHWSAFWLQSPAIGRFIGNTRISGTEIDIVEYMAMLDNIIEHALHWDGYQESHKVVRSFTSIPGINDGYQTFGLEWTRNEYIFYVNGKETWRTNKAISHRPQYIVLSLEVDYWAGNISEAILPDSICIDYVRVYR